MVSDSTFTWPVTRPLAESRITASVCSIPWLPLTKTPVR